MGKGRFPQFACFRKFSTYEPLWHNKREKRVHRIGRIQQGQVPGVSL